MHFKALKKQMKYKEDIAAEIAERISGRYIKEFELLLNELRK